MRNDVYQRLESAERFGIKLGLDQIKSLLQELGNPQDTFRSILIAGTNGKGSVSAMLESIFLTSGFRTGLYTSPHLIDVRERIRVGGEMISRAEFENGLAIVFSAIDRLTASSVLESTPTHFEILTATAFYHFSRAKIDLGVVEVGLGGRFDATNVLQQMLSVITTIDFDHQEFLGRTLSEIAFEKAGIFKPGVPAIVGHLPEEAARVIFSAAKEKGCQLNVVNHQDVMNLHLEDGFPVFEYRPWGKEVQIHLRGRHQAANAAIALLACDIAEQSGILLDKGKVINALKSVQWPGRLQILSKEPPVLIDSAHNPMGVRSLVSFLEDMKWDRVIVLFTAMKDKDIPSMLRNISGKVEKIFLTRVPPEKRCASITELFQAAEKEGIPSETEESLDHALEKARQFALEKRLPLLIFGSIYLVGRVLELAGEKP